MNNTYTASSLAQQPQQNQNQSAQQPQQQSAQSIAYIPAHAHLQQHLNTITEEHLANSGGAYFGGRALEKAYANYVAPTGRYYTSAATTTAAGLPSLTGPHNTILITNNFAQQNLPQNDAIATVLPQTHAAHNFNNTNNIHILSTAPNNSNNNNLFNNLNKDVTIDPATTLRLPHRHYYQQAQQQNQQFAAHLSNLQQAHQYQQHFAALSTQQPPNNALNHNTMHFGATSTAPHYFTHATTEQLTNVDNNKLLPGLVDVAAITTTKPTTNAPTNSTVVLDRINICINNHYNEALTTNNNIDTPLTCSTIQTADNTIQQQQQQQEQQPSPVIPAIQHKATLLTDNVATLLNSVTIANIENNNAIHVIDEPDSTTTTSITPPITPNNVTNEQIILLNSPLHQSPSTTTAISAETIALTINEGMDREAETKTINIKSQQHQVDVLKNTIPTTTIVIDCDENEEEEEEAYVKERSVVDKQTNEIKFEEDRSSNASLTSTVEFKVGEDVLLKRQDNRFYLGTVIGNAHEQYLVRFDDQSEQWCVANEMRKLGGGGACKTDKTTKNDVDNSIENLVEKDTPMCVSCKQLRPNDIVECCERCGRGYHRGCTTEIYTGSNEWLCKRCAKPMKVYKNNEHEEQILTVCRQLPYHVETLNWDEKHRVNEEQIYCYCGKTGKFDNNMLQCCKCKNWFHTNCIQNFKQKLLRGDCFFVFCCSVCQNGEEFVRRLQIDWVDVLHLTLYNLSALKKHQHHRYHHLVKDIWPYVLVKRHSMPIPIEWRELPDTVFMEHVKNTLKENTNRFVCGREGKRDQYYYALRHNGPPLPPILYVNAYDELTDELLIKKFNLTLLTDAPENVRYFSRKNTRPDSEQKHNANICEFHIDDDEKFTSDDDMPIKMIIDKVKRNKLTESVENKFEKSEKFPKPVLDDSGLVKSTEIKLDRSNVQVEVPNEKEKPTHLRSSRKRKTFTHLKSYKESAEGTNNRFYSVDSSSDENSSSSRATSLDIIIPPPKNFLGPNNPFRMVTPKKHNHAIGSGNANGGARAVKNSILNTSGLDFSSKLAALKSVGIFQNLSTSNLAKAGGQARTVRTIKRRLSAKDIMIGPNQEVRRRRTRRTSANVEVISTTTINPIHSNLFPLHAKDLYSNSVTQKAQTSSNSSSPNTMSSSSRDSNDARVANEHQRPTHGRLLRQRPQKQSPNNSRRSSMSSSSSHQSFCLADHRNNNHNAAQLPPKKEANEDLKLSVNKYFGAVNRIESGEQFCVRARRRLANGQLQYLIEWGSD